MVIGCEKLLLRLRSVLKYQKWDSQKLKDEEVFASQLKLFTTRLSDDYFGCKAAMLLINSERKSAATKLEKSWNFLQKLRAEKKRNNLHPVGFKTISFSGSLQQIWKFQESDGEIVAKIIHLSHCSFRELDRRSLESRSVNSLKKSMITNNKLEEKSGRR